MKIAYAIENDLHSSDFIQVLEDSGLAVRRPVDDIERINNMLRKANLIITARIGSMAGDYKGRDGQLVGVARSLSDFAYATYLSDLAVSIEFQQLGIGRELIRQTKIASGKAKLILLSAPSAADYYPRIGMTRHEQCFCLDDINDLR
jgi:hypothetical protein